MRKITLGQLTEKWLSAAAIEWNVCVSMILYNWLHQTWLNKCIFFMHFTFCVKLRNGRYNANFKLRIEWIRKSSKNNNVDLWFQCHGNMGIILCILSNCAIQLATKFHRIALFNNTCSFTFQVSSLSLRLTFETRIFFSSSLRRKIVKHCSWSGKKE